MLLNFDKIKNFKISYNALLFVLIAVVAFFAFQVSKNYTQASRLSDDLDVTSRALINGNLIIYLRLNIGGITGPSLLNVAGPAYFDGLVHYGFVPESYSSDYNAVTAEYVDTAVLDYFYSR